MSGPQNPTTAPLRFGIYPGGPAGSVNPKAPTVPEDPARRLAAVQELAGAHPFVVHLYTGWSGDAGKDARTATWLDGEIRGFTDAGIQVELVARYEPLTLDGQTAVRGFAGYVRGLIDRYGDDPNFIGLQIGNEANLAGAPDASDGSAPAAIEALVAGVLAAKDEVRRSGRLQVEIGINWAYDARPSASSEFWAALGQAGGQAFAQALDWVGLDAYPGTWGPQLELGGSLPTTTAAAVTDALKLLRHCYLPMAGIGHDVPLHVSENGFPTGPGRSPAEQAVVLDAMVRGIDAVRGAYNVTDYRWFDLRDSASSDANVESQYGITYDQYVPKPAFATYRDLIAELGGGPRQSRATPAGAAGAAVAAAVARAACRTSPLRTVVPVWQLRKLVKVHVLVDGRLRRSARPRKTPWVMRLALAPGRRRVVIRQVVRSGGRSLVRVRRTTVTICR